MGKSRHIKHYQKSDINDDQDEYNRNDKFKSRRQNRLKKLHDREDIENDGEETQEYS